MRSPATHRIAAVSACIQAHHSERDLFIDNLLVRIHANNRDDFSSGLSTLSSEIWVVRSDLGSGHWARPERRWRAGWLWALVSVPIGSGLRHRAQGTA